MNSVKFKPFSRERETDRQADRQRDRQRKRERKRERERYRVHIEFKFVYTSQIVLSV